MVHGKWRWSCSARRPKIYWRRLSRLRRRPERAFSRENNPSISSSGVPNFAAGSSIGKNSRATVSASVVCTRQIRRLPCTSTAILKIFTGQPADVPALELRGVVRRQPKILHRLEGLEPVEHRQGIEIGRGNDHPRLWPPDKVKLEIELNRLDRDAGRACDQSALLGSHADIELHLLARPRMAPAIGADSAALGAG